MNSKAIGEVSEAVILGHLAKLGNNVLIPFGNNQRYDLVIEKDGKFIRGQCKTARIRLGCAIFQCSSTNGFTGKKTSYHGQVEVFWVYCPENGKIYQVPVSETKSTQTNLRIDQPKGMRKAIKWARDYEI